MVWSKKNLCDIPYTKAYVISRHVMMIIHIIITMYVEEDAIILFQTNQIVHTIQLVHV